jgi:hypothetical protein
MSDQSLQGVMLPSSIRTLISRRVQREVAGSCTAVQHENTDRSACARQACLHLSLHVQSEPAK